MEKFCLASGSSGNAYVLNQDNDCILLECGLKFDNLVKKLHSFNIAINEINAVVVTHNHNDHALSLQDFEMYGKQIISPNTIEKYHKFNISNSCFSLYCFPVCHDVVAYGYAITNNKTHENILFINDTSCCNLPDEVLKTKFDYIFIECNHTRRKLKELLESASEEHAIKLDRQLKFHLSLAGTKKMLSYLDLSNTKEIYLMHLSQEASEPKVMQQVVEQTFKVKTYICKRKGGIDIE